MVQNMRHSEDIKHRLETDGIIAVADTDPAMNAALYRAVARGELVSVLPGILARLDSADHARIRMLALHRRDPNVVFTGLTAAALLWNPDALPSVVEASSALRVRSPGFLLSTWRPDPDWISDVGAFRCTNPELTAIDLIPRRGGEFVDFVIRRSGPAGQEALNRMWAALRAHPQRPGNVERARLLEDSRGLPWSEVERLAHRQLRELGIVGWVANGSVPTRDAVYAVDLLFAKHNLIVEIDGFEFHSSRTTFERDRSRQNALVEAGWRVLRFTWAMVDSGEWIPVLQRCLGESASPTAC